jgi:hypothetical protein
MSAGCSGSSSRRESIDTTLKYPSGRNTETTADPSWQVYQRVTAGNTSGNRGPFEPTRPAPSEDAQRTGDRTSPMDRGGIEPPTHGFSEVRPMTQGPIQQAT